MASRKKRKHPRSRTKTSAAAQPSSFTGNRDLVVITRPTASVRATPRAVMSVTGADVSGLGSVLGAVGATLVPMFGPEDRVARFSMAPAVAADAAVPVMDLTTFYRVDAPDERLDEIADRLLALEDLVDGAYVKPRSEPPVCREEGMLSPSANEVPPVSPAFAARQGYLDAAPGGIDARFAWTRAGGKGQGVRIIDIEGAWRYSHEDLIQNQGGVIGGTASTDLGWRNHGTAVIGEFGADDNAFGVTGICPLANVRSISIFGSGQSSAKAITDAANALSPGDIILIELHAPGPRFNFGGRADQRGYIAMEFWPADFAAIVYATSVRGVIVVEAGGNGAENLDDPLYERRPNGFPSTWRNPFNRANPQSGAMLVGAGAPPPGTHGRNHGPDRSRLEFSNFGARVDVQGWGREVTTTGYGGLQGGGSEDLWYTDTFSGTSSASPIVVGAIGCLQGALRGAGKPLLTPVTARDLLRATGSPQQDAQGRPTTQRIGNRPNLRQALERLGLGGLVGKLNLKDLKEKREKIETKEKLEKPEKREKPEKVELKEKEVKEKEAKEIKEKELKEFKEVKELKEKDIFENFREHEQQQGGGATAGNASLETRVAAIESTLATLSHFITTDLRPDLQSSALKDEADYNEQRRQLDMQATSARALKEVNEV